MNDRNPGASSRRVSGVERLWLAADRFFPPFVNQMVIEGEGWPEPPDPHGWPGVMRRLADAQPGLALQLRGSLVWSRWHTGGPPPRFRELDGSRWSGVRPEGAPFLREPLDPVDGPIAELLLLRGEPTRLVLRTHHAAVDGQGTLLAARGLFALLRGEPPPRAAAGPLNDLRLARDLGVPRERALPQDAASPLGEPRGADFDVTWLRLSLPGRPSRLLARTAVALARRAQLPPDTTYRVDVPVDLRPHVPGIQSTANLTGMVHLPMEPHLDEPDPAESFQRALKLALDNWEAPREVRSVAWARWLPVGFMARVARWSARRCLERNRYGSSAILSNLGLLDPADYSGGGFRARRIFFVPPGNPGVPLFLAMSGGPEGVEFCATSPVALASDGRLATLLGGVVEELSQEP